MAMAAAPDPRLLRPLLLLFGRAAIAAALAPLRSLQAAPPACPVSPAALHAACAPESLGGQLLADPLLETISSGASAWHHHLWEADGAAITSSNASSPGANVNVESHSDAHAYDVILYQSVALNASESYALCLQAGAAAAGQPVRFAVDGGQALDFATAGGGERERLLTAQGGLVEGCFRFALAPTASGEYLGRVALEFGEVTGDVAVCQVSLRRCRQHARPSPCPAADLAPPLDAWRCPAESLGEELLMDPRFTLPGGTAWSTYGFQQDRVNYDFASSGVLVDVQEHEDAHLYDALLHQEVDLNATGGASYELCVQAAANRSGDELRFAVDGGERLNFTTAGGGLRRTYMELEEGALTTSCFRFTLEPSAERYHGRVALELGTALGEVAVCQASLRRCLKPAARVPDPVRRCYLPPLVEGGGCTQLSVLEGSDFGLNEFGQETTAARRCLAALRNTTADSLTVASGRCELWRCGSREALLASAQGPGAAASKLYSELCEYQEPTGGRGGEERRSPVLVQLWDWKFTDVAKECEEYLAPSGFEAVQVAPVTEHILGFEWWTKYQPVSFRLESRSGSAAEFRSMVQRCRAAGVQVMVDVLLNHAARPCDAVRLVGDGAGMPCRGWAGSPYGNRRLGGLHGWPLMDPEDFHHLRDDRLRNCAVDTANYQCPDSTPPNDCSVCDLYGMPDWRTESPEVREMLWKHIEELHDAGVTMLRIDAASYMHVEDLAAVLGRAPWDFVLQEWWGGVPEPQRTHLVGYYRDYNYGVRIKEALEGEASALGSLLELSQGVDGIPQEQVVAALTDHDQKPDVSYKSGLAFHQEQKWMLAWPKAFSMRLFGGFGWATAEDGPPGCEEGDSHCQPKPVYDSSGVAQCMPTPVRTPLDVGLSSARVWVCEHRWTGVAGLIGFRKACRGLPIERTWLLPEKGRLAFRAGGCFAALQTGYNTQERPIQRPGDWSLVGLDIGLPPGRYCDASSLAMPLGHRGQGCPRTVEVGEGGVVLQGVVPEGDVLAIHTGLPAPNASAAGGDGEGQQIPVSASALARPRAAALALLLLARGALLEFAA